MRSRKIGQQKIVTQKRRKGRRVNIMGIWEKNQRLEYSLKVGTYKAKSYLRFMNWQAERAMKRLFKTGKPTIIVQDNASIHRSKLAKKHHQNWLQQGLSVFFLPPYSPEMNRIEGQWRRAYRLMSSSSTTGGFSNRALKRQELGGYVFEDEYDLAKAIIEGLKNRGQQGNYLVERLLFN